MSQIHAVITGVGGYVPEYKLTNEELCRMVDTNDEWITTRVGIKERRILKGKNLGASHGFCISACHHFTVKPHSSGSQMIKDDQQRHDLCNAGRTSSLLGILLTDHLSGGSLH